MVCLLPQGFMGETQAHAYLGNYSVSVNSNVRKRLTVDYNEIKHPLKIELFFTSSLPASTLPSSMCHFTLSHLFCYLLQISRNR